MPALKQSSDAVHWFMGDLGARVVAESGRPSDRFHIGKLVLQSLKDAPDFIMQIDAATGESETYKSVLKRTVKCAHYFKKLGLKAGDVIVLMAPGHIDLAIPFYAALYLGIPVSALDANLEVLELESMFEINQPKLVFCQNKRAPIVKEALKNIKAESTVITFDQSEECVTFQHFMEDAKEDDVDQFRATDFDTEETIAFLASTSGSTGFPKCVALTHKNLVLSIPYLWIGFTTFPTPTRLVLVSSPLHWLSAGFHFLLSPILRYTRLQISDTLTQDNYVKAVNSYRPSYSTVSPTLLTTLIKPSNRETVDITCFDTILIGGSAVPQELIEEIKKISPNTSLHALYGMSEIGGLALYDAYPAPGSMGRPVRTFEYRLVDAETKKDITEPHVNGELWLKGPCICKGYYNNPEATKAAFEEGGWLKTGDIFYRDEHYFFYFVDRLKLLLKYKNHQVSPVEVEAVIHHHPGVLDVAVTGIPDPECGDLAVACVVSKAGYSLKAQEIKDLVKYSLTDSKQLHGGVIFMNELPTTASTKVDRQRLKKMVLTMQRE